jgi:hypothetical protein
VGAAVGGATVGLGVEGEAPQEAPEYVIAVAEVMNFQLSFSSHSIAQVIIPAVPVREALPLYKF